MYINIFVHNVIIFVYLLFMYIYICFLCDLLYKPFIGFAHKYHIYYLSFCLARYCSLECINY